MSILTARQELAGMVAAAMFNGTSATSMRAPDVARVCVREALVVADEIIHQADSQSDSDQSEMARTIQRLERRIESLKNSLKIAASAINSGHHLSSVVIDINADLSRDDLEACK